MAAVGVSTILLKQVVGRARPYESPDDPYDFTAFSGQGAVAEQPTRGHVEQVQICVGDVVGVVVDFMGPNHLALGLGHLELLFRNHRHLDFVLLELRVLLPGRGLARLDAQAVQTSAGLVHLNK